jgi:hypothetical protein
METSMSRGHGKLQRRLLELLEAAPYGYLSTTELVEGAFDLETVGYSPEHDRGRRISTLRALRRLEDEGVVELAYLRYADGFVREVWRLAKPEDAAAR